MLRGGGVPRRQQPLGGCRASRSSPLASHLRRGGGLPTTHVNVHTKGKTKKRGVLVPRAAADDAPGGGGGEMNTNILYERMKALQAKEAAENSAVVDAAIEQDQARKGRRPFLLHRHTFFLSFSFFHIILRVQLALF